MRQYKVTVDGTEFVVSVEPYEGGFKAQTVKKEQAVVEAPKEEKIEKAAAVNVPTSGDVTSPMPGKVLDIKASVGDSVDVGDVIAILEAMKMEIEVTATAKGKVTSINVQKGATVNTGDIVAVIG
ncbi:MAG: biotin/lipoyl-containing protein [Bacillota bacterium]|nr:biotin/lipoyl-containing protein [Bacillota bacterium]